VPLPLITRAIAPLVPPLRIEPLKVVEPQVGLSVRTDVKPVVLLMRLPPPESEATCWLTAPRSSVALDATVRAVVAGRRLVPPTKSFKLAVIALMAS
jgi:hypothetical protein